MLNLCGVDCRYLVGKLYDRDYFDVEDVVGSANSVKIYFGFIGELVSKERRIIMEFVGEALLEILIELLFLMTGEGKLFRSIFLVVPFSLIFQLLLVAFRQSIIKIAHEGGKIQFD